jgi:hypothetical protein
MDGRINVAEAPDFMVSRRPPNPAEKATPASIPRPNSPLENTLHNTGVIGVAFVPASVTAFQMAAQFGCATQFYGAQYALLPRRQRCGVRVAKLLAMRTHNIGDFECRPHKEAGGLL